MDLRTFLDFDVKKYYLFCRLYKEWSCSKNPPRWVPNGTNRTERDLSSDDWGRLGCLDNKAHNQKAWRSTWQNTLTANRDFALFGRLLYPRELWSSTLIDGPGMREKVTLRTVEGNWRKYWVIIGSKTTDSLSCVGVDIQ